MSVRLDCALVLACVLALVTGCQPDPPPEPPPSSTSARFDPTEITLKEVGQTGLKELVDNGLTFTDSEGRKWTAPRGTLTDGASVPRYALAVSDGRFDEKFLKAAVVHDAYCQDINKERCPEQYRTLPWKDVHRMFYDGCLAGRTPQLRAKIMFAAVWLFGPRWDDPAADEARELPDETRLIGLSGSMDWIEQNDPNIEDIQSDLEQREPLLVELHKQEKKVQEAIEQKQWKQAEEAINQQEVRLAAALKDAPQDLMLLNFKGNAHKKKAELYRASDLRGDADQELKNAEKTFQKVLGRQKTDPSALKGMSGVALDRGDLSSAKKYVDEAIRDSAEPGVCEARARYDPPTGEAAAEVEKEVVLAASHRSRPGNAGSAPCLPAAHSSPGLADEITSYNVKLISPKGDSSWGLLLATWMSAICLPCASMAKYLPDAEGTATKSRAAFPWPWLRCCAWAWNACAWLLAWLVSSPADSDTV